MFVASFALVLGSVSFASPQLFGQIAHAVSPAGVVVNKTTNTQYHTIQEAVSAANASDKIEIGAGTYTEAVIINTPLTLVGDPGATLAVNTTTVNGITVNANDVSISGLTIAGPAVGSSYMSFPWGNDVTRGIVVTNGVTNFSITDNVITSLRNDILIDGRNTGSVTGNTIDNSKSGVSVQYTDGTGIAIAGNSEGVFGNDWGVNLHLNGHFVGSTAYSTSQKIATLAPSAAQDVILANSSANNGWTVQDQGYALSNRTAVTVATNGASPTAQGDPQGPISTVQGGLNAITKNGTVNVKNGIYTEGSSNPANGLTFTNPGTHLVGESEAGTIIVPVSNEYGQGLTSEGVGEVTMGNLTVKGTSTSGGAALKFHNFSGLTLSNIDVTGVGTPHSTGIDINGVSNVSLNNVNVTGFGKNGIAVTAKFADSDVLTQNVAFNNVSSNNNSWAGLAFYNSNNSGSVAGNITGVTFTGANQLENNGEGLFFEGDTDANHIAHNTPLYTISGVGNASVDLGNTTFSGNFLDIDNYQTNNVNASNAVFGTKTGNQMYASEQTTENNLIIDQRDYSAFGLVNYYTTTASISAPTDARWLNHQGDVLGVFTNVNLVTPAWTAPTSGTVDHYEYSYTSPTAGWSAPVTLTAATSIPDQSFYGSGNNGTEGPWQFEVRAVSPTGDVSEWTQSPVLTYDKTTPAIPNNLTWLDSNNQSTNNGFTNIQKGTLSWKDSTPTDVDHYVYKFWTNISGYFDGASNAWATSDSQYITKSSTGGSIWTDFANKQGTYYFCVEAVDAAGNTSACSNTLAVTYDNTPPIGLNNLSPFDGIITTTAAQTSIDWINASDTSGTVYYYYQSSHSSVTNLDGSFVSPVYTSGVLTSSQIATPGTPEGVYYWHVRAVDAAGNSTGWTTPWKVTVDNTAPSSTNNLANLVNGTVTIQQHITDNFASKSGKLRIWKLTSGGVADNSKFFAIGDLAVDGNNIVTYSLNTVANLFGDGNYIAKFTSTDQAGNASVSQVNFKVDNSGPVVTIADITIPITIGSVIPTVTASDASAPITYLWTADSANPAVLSFTNNIAEPTFTPTAAGLYKFTLLTTDALGNQTTKTFEFTYTPAVVDNTGTTTTPSAIVVTPQPTTNNLGPQAVLGTQTIADNTAATQTPAADTLGAPAVKGASTQLASTTTPSSSSTGLAWYWWVLIVAAIVSFVWWLIARLRNRSNVA